MEKELEQWFLLRGWGSTGKGHEGTSGGDGDGSRLEGGRQEGLYPGLFQQG